MKKLLFIGFLLIFSVWADEKRKRFVAELKKSENSPNSLAYAMKKIKRRRTLNYWVDSVVD